LPTGVMEYWSTGVLGWITGCIWIKVPVFHSSIIPVSTPLLPAPEPRSPTPQSSPIWHANCLAIVMKFTSFPQTNNKFRQHKVQKTHVTEGDQSSEKGKPRESVGRKAPGLSLKFLDRVLSSWIGWPGCRAKMGPTWSCFTHGLILGRSQRVKRSSS
jgi:hypothetical protein